jgi:glucose-1-phosphate adenylyltransferase
VGEHPVEDAKFFRVTEKGTTLITKDMVKVWQAAQ